MDLINKFLNPNFYKFEFMYILFKQSLWKVDLLPLIFEYV